MSEPHERVKILDIDYVKRRITCVEVDGLGRPIGPQKTLEENTRERVTNFHRVGDVVDIWVDRPEMMNKPYRMGAVHITRMTYPRVRVDEVAARIIEANARDTGDERDKDEILADFIEDQGPISTEKFVHGPYLSNKGSKTYKTNIIGEKGLVRGEFSIMSADVLLMLEKNVITMSVPDLPEAALGGLAGRQIDEVIDHPWLAGKITKAEIVSGLVRPSLKITLCVPERVVRPITRQEVRQAV